MIAKIRRKIKWAWRDLIRAPLPPMSTGKGEIRVLCFHGVCPDDRAYINGRFMHLTAFKNLLVLLKDRTNILSAEDFSANNISHDRLNILLTFDDGYLNNFDLALPVLDELCLPSVWFVTGQREYLCMDLFDIAEDARLDLHGLRALMGLPSFSARELKRALVQANRLKVRAATKWLIDATVQVRDQYTVFWNLLQDQHLTELSKHPLVTVANHTFEHLDQTVLTKEEGLEEIKNCEARLGQYGLNAHKWVAIPYGNVNNRVLEYLEEQNYCSIFVNELTPDSDGKAVERLTVNPFISQINQAYAIYNGSY